MHRLTLTNFFSSRITPVSLMSRQLSYWLRESESNRRMRAYEARLGTNTVPAISLSLFLYILYRKFFKKSNFESSSGLLGCPPLKVESISK